MSGSPVSKPKRKAIPRIEAVAIRGYKSLEEEARVRFAPVTVLAGANSAGKSSLMQPLLLLKQTLDAPYDPGPLRLDGPNVKLTSVEQMLSHRPGKARAKDFEIEIAAANASCIRLRFERASKGIELAEMWNKEPEVEPQRIALGMEPEEIGAIMPEHLIKLAEELGKDETKYDWSVVRDRCFFAFELAETESKRRVRLYGETITPAAPLIPLISEIIHLPGLRGNPERTYKRTHATDSFPGTFENYVASVIAHWEESRDSRLEQLGDDLTSLGLTWKVATSPLNDTQVELRVGRMPAAVRGGANDLVNIADVGFGMSQTLPVVVGLLVAEPGALVYLEQPEIHLHPRAQGALAKVIANAASRGVQVVVETHSSILVRSIQILVARNALPPNDVALYWFQRDAKTGMTRVDASQMDDDGAFGDWPEDFDDVSLGVEQAYLDAVEQRMAAH
jgi:hypothetical protein